MAKYQHPTHIADWLRANGINISHIPVDSDLTISTSKDGQRTVHYEELITNDDDRVINFGDGPRTVRRSAPLTVDPPDWWQPYEKPTREQLAAAVERVTATVTALEAQAADFNAHHNPACECEWGEALAEAASRVRAALDGTPGTVLTTDRVLTAEEYEEIKTRWNQEHGGGRQNHAVPITTGPSAKERPCLCPGTGLVNEHMQGCPYEKPQEN